jgi:D-beta-D-heptose 7-phosphate kinase/D-beta-D-heptose 1-phosphate adenosyltransferase
METASPEFVHQILERISALRVAVVGDVMLDRFVMGRVDRISPEAPVPVVHVVEDEERLGGAANVALNAVALGAQVAVFGVVGPGEMAARLRGELRARGIDARGLVESTERLTTVKTRIMAGHQQVVRIDRESEGPIDGQSRQRLLGQLDGSGPFDAVVVSDYGKGVVGEELMELLRAWRGKGRPVVVDPKQGNFELYRETTCITPNEREAGGAQHDRIRDAADAERVGHALRQRLGNELLLLTRGEHGMVIFREQEPPIHLPTEASHVFDVTGAGDTVIATFTCFLAAGAGAVTAARASNLAAGIVIRELGTAVASRSNLVAAWEQRFGARP